MIVDKENIEGKIQETEIEVLAEYVERLMKEKSQCQNEEEIARINERINCISKIAKLVSRELNAPAESEQEHLIKIMNALLSSTASININKVGDDLIVKIFDSYLKKIVMILHFKHCGYNLHLLSYQINE